VNQIVKLISQGAALVGHNQLVMEEIAKSAKQHVVEESKSQTNWPLANATVPTPIIHPPV
jgi:hypothetical protein